MTKASLLLSAVVLAAPLAACGGSQPPSANGPPPAASSGPNATEVVEAPASSQVPAPPATKEVAHKLAIEAAACWFGGIWADALGEEGDIKKANVESRCRGIERQVWETDDNARYETLRALETKSVADVIARVDALAKSDAVDAPRHDNLVKLTTMLVEALKETMEARRAGDRIKRDLKTEPERLSKDEVEAVVPLRAHAKLDALYEIDAGDLSKEAHALALLCALDRVELARGLPKHLKLYAVVDTFHMLFGVPAPDVPTDATRKLVPGTWLKFLSDTAAAAGHPVPEKAKTPREKDTLAWAGMLEGISEKLKAESDGVAASTDLNRVVTTVLHRLEMEYRAQQAAEDSMHSKKK